MTIWSAAALIVGTCAAAVTLVMLRITIAEYRRISRHGGTSAASNHATGVQPGQSPPPDPHKDEKVAFQPIGAGI